MEIEWLADKQMYYYLTLALVASGVLMLHRFLHSPFGYAMRAARDSVLRADAIGINVRRINWAEFVIAGAFARLAGGAVCVFKRQHFARNNAREPLD